MTRSKSPKEQIIPALRHVKSETPIVRIYLRIGRIGMNEATFTAGKRESAHTRVKELGRMRQMEEENNRLKRLVADLMLTSNY